MEKVRPDVATAEEKLVAELVLLGISYLTRQTDYQANQVRPPEQLFVDLLQQPSARVRAAVIAVLLAHPDYAKSIPAAFTDLLPHDQLTLDFFYNAAVLLQQEHATQLRRYLPSPWQWLPPLQESIVAEDIPAVGSPREKLAALGRLHQQLTHTAVNWRGTYENVVYHLLHRWALEAQWKR